MANYITLAGSVALLVLFVISTVEGVLKEGECEVCVKFLGKFIDTVTEEDRKDSELVEQKFIKFCKKVKGKEDRFCYYVGGKKDSATGILNSLTKPITYHMPAEKICEKFKKLDAQICDLQYDKTIDLKTANLKKLKVKELRKILEAWDEECKGCAEKTDFIRRVEELMPKHDPDAAKHREEL